MRKKIIPAILLPSFYLWLIAPRFTKRGDMLPYRHQMIAHRGYHSIRRGIPENSMTAFKEAIRHGYGIEIDVHLTKDGQLVVFHDHNLKRICGVDGIIEDMSFEELRNLRLSGTNEHIPTFREVLDLVNGQYPLLIELKLESSSLAICKKTYEELQDYEGDYLIQSFNTLCLLWFRIHAPKILRGQLSSNLTADPLSSPWLLRFATRFLFANALGRPDFISYKLKDLPMFNLKILQNLLHTPVAVWTLKTPEAIAEGRRHYQMQIFETV